MDMLGFGRIGAIALVLAGFAASAPVEAQAPAGSAQTQDPHAAEQNAAWEAAGKAGSRGPAEITFIDQAVLKLPDGYVFIPKAEAARLMRTMGNTIHEPRFIGLIFGTRQNDQWFVAVNYIKEGYVKDDDAKDWNADDLLQNVKDATDEGNKDRLARGFPELQILGWAEKPAYDAATHRLAWALLSKDKNASDSAEKEINDNTYLLGRDGYFSLNLVTSASRLNADKMAAQELLASLAYNSGKRYDDFNASTDHIAEYGIAALVGGVVAKKLGLFALVAVFVLKFAKIIGIAVLAFGAGIWNFIRRKSKNTVS
jgi:uncharacterized membrane-anchored protein